ncbi:replication restart DNA helicase PriA [filamentous cyanobacterium CCP5]|nr:replication restart DNA helicase PriA [filamentous cyanobacterium CCP5]
MQAVAFRVSCPNCGQPAERHYLEQQQQIRTQCPRCDYLMTVSAETGSVIEAYAPGLPTLAR